jgi:sulfite reductase alpha subunit-like flavoprotein
MFDMLSFSWERVIGKFITQSLSVSFFCIHRVRCSYQCGDVALVYPQNLPDEVEKVLEYFGWTELGDVPFRLKPNAPGRILFLIHLFCNSELQKKIH